jgi:hypothetical protein
MSREKSVPIENFDIVTTNTATSFRVEIKRLNLFVSADLRVILFNKTNGIVRCDNLVLAGDDYKNWANSDEYVINYVAKYYGFILKSNTSSIPTEVVPTEYPISNVVNNMDEETLIPV